MKIFFITLGCKVNQYETQSMREAMIINGFSLATYVEEADVIVFNSCTVTATSDHKVKKLISRARRQNKKAVIVLTGCMTQAFPEVAYNLYDVDVVLGNSNRAELYDSIQNFINTGERVINIKEYTPKSKFDTAVIKHLEKRTRAFIKIEDGCNRFCSYCIIPYARGRVRSKSIEDIIYETESLAKSGHKEIVLVGINLSSYGTDIGTTLFDAISAVGSIDGIKRIRLGSLEPEKLDAQIIKKLATEKKLCPQFHLSLQSGCDETLKRMNRHYTTRDYKEIVNNLRLYFKNSAITTDIMVGFPGETESEFEESFKFAKEIEFAKMHVFAYSRRPGTKADKMSDQVPEEIKAKRSKKMCELEYNLRLSFLKSQIGKASPVLFEVSLKNEFYEGYTPNYIPVRVQSNINLCNSIVDVKFESVTQTSKQIFLIGKGEKNDFVL